MNSYDMYSYAFIYRIKGPIGDFQQIYETPHLKHQMNQTSIEQRDTFLPELFKEQYS